MKKKLICQISINNFSKYEIFNFYFFLKNTFNSIKIGIIVLTKTAKTTVLRAPQINKDSREQFESIKYSAIFSIEFIHQKYKYVIILQVLRILKLNPFINMDSTLKIKQNAKTF
jgi:ribosomal protein S10